MLKQFDLLSFFNMKSPNQNMIVYVFFLYIVFMLLPQIFSFDLHQSFELLYKLILLVLFTFYFLYFFSKDGISRRGFLISLLYGVSQLLTLLFSNVSSFNKLDTTYLVSFLYVFIFFSLAANQVISKDQIYRFFQLFSFLIVISGIFNLIININKIPYILTISSTNDLFFKSFFENRNTYAKFVSFGSIASISVFLKKKTIFNFFIIVFLLINLILTLSRTSILATIVFILFLILSQEKIKTKLIAFTIASFFLVFVYKSTFFDSFINVLLRIDRGFSGREHIWKFCWDLFIHGNVFFGYGYSLGYNKAVYNFETGFHSGYFNILISGGIIYFLFFLYFIFLAIYNILLVKKYDKMLGNVFLGFLFFFLVTSISEDVTLFQTSVISFLFTSVLVLFPRCYLNHIQKTLYISNQFDHQHRTKLTSDS